MNEADIREGLRNREFTFFYQPKISLITGKVAGVEALIRWVRPDGRIVLPAAFIPLAEQSSLIREISQQMFPNLIKDMLLLSDVSDIPVAFNASARDFEDDQLQRVILESLNMFRLPYDSLQIELTETALLQAHNLSMRNHITPLREAGIGLVMDDFGKGYSSIDTLSQWPFNMIKIDHDLIARMMDSRRSATIVDSTLRMAHELGIDVIAEGVETHAQYHHLLAAGCTNVQGFWISKALPLHHLIAFIDQDLRWSGLPVGLIHMAAIDHVQWRKQLVSELVMAAAQPADSPHRHFLNTPPLSCRDCRLGKWYYGDGQIFANRAPFAALEHPHEMFHRTGIRLIDQVKQGASVEALTPLLRELSDISMEVMRQLQSLENEGLIDMHEAHEVWRDHFFHPDAPSGKP